MSVYWLTKHLSGMASFTNDTCLLQALSVKRPLEIGRLRDGLYLLFSKCLRNNNSITAVSDHCCDVNSSFLNNMQCHSPSPVNKSLLNQMQNHSLSIVNTSPLNVDVSCSVSNSYVYKDNNVNPLWHNRLGHVPFIKMKDISTIPAEFSPKQPFICTICPLARQTTLPFP